LKVVNAYYYCKKSLNQKRTGGEKERKKLNTNRQKTINKVVRYLPVNSYFKHKVV
jgi:hypothetical protein